MLFSEPKIPQSSASAPACSSNCAVSVLFSEPKIPQSAQIGAARGLFPGFSALQRAENSSIRVRGVVCGSAYWFQCSSASRKFLNGRRGRFRHSARQGFSALQRAENSSMRATRRHRRGLGSFSALQRAENSSIYRPLRRDTRTGTVSVLFSEPKIPQ